MNPAEKFGAAARPQSEDCLTLSVFTPGIAGRRPVLLWIHGGGFMYGSKSDYLAPTLARKQDIVLVSINYRLGTT